MIKENIRNDEIKKSLLKKFFLHFHIVLLFILITNSICFYIDNSIFYFKQFLIFTCYEFFITALILKMSYDQLHPFVMPYLIGLYLFCWYFILCIWHSNPAVLAIFAAFPFGVYNIFPKKVVLIWFIVVILSIIITIFIPPSIFSNHYPIINPNYENIRILISFMIFFAFLFFYNNKINRTSSESVSENSEINKPEDKFNETYENLYQQIISHIELYDLWKDPDFSIQDLAEKLNTNSTYISRAVNHSSGTNFKTLVNKYRIEYIKKELLSEQSKKKYSLLYIYTSAGFRHQSTFNKAFKQIENMTPSEYILMIANKNIPFPDPANV